MSNLTFDDRAEHAWVLANEHVSSYPRENVDNIVAIAKETGVPVIYVMAMTEVARRFRMETNLVFNWKSAERMYHTIMSTHG